MINLVPKTKVHSRVGVLRGLGGPKGRPVRGCHRGRWSRPARSNQRMGWPRASHLNLDYVIHHRLEKYYSMFCLNIPDT